MNRKPHKPRGAPPQLIDVRSTAATLGVSRWTIYYWARAGVLQSVKLGRRRLFELAELEKSVKRGRSARRLAKKRESDAGPRHEARG
jgi:excisionase family DNA binding protein